MDARVARDIGQWRGVANRPTRRLHQAAVDRGQRQPPERSRHQSHKYGPSSEHEGRGRGDQDTAPRSSPYQARPPEPTQSFRKQSPENLPVAGQATIWKGLCSEPTVAHSKNQVDSRAATHDVKAPARDRHASSNPQLPQSLAAALHQARSTRRTRIADSAIETWSWGVKDIEPITGLASVWLAVRDRQAEHQTGEDKWVQCVPEEASSWYAGVAQDRGNQHQTENWAVGGLSVWAVKT